MNRPKRCQYLLGKVSTECGGKKYLSSEGQECQYLLGKVSTKDEFDLFVIERGENTVSISIR